MITYSVKEWRDEFRRETVIALEMRVSDYDFCFAEWVNLSIRSVIEHVEKETDRINDILQGKGEVKNEGGF